MQLPKSDLYQGQNVILRATEKKAVRADTRAKNRCVPPNTHTERFFSTNGQNTAVLHAVEGFIILTLLIHVKCTVFVKKGKPSSRAGLRFYFT